MIEVRSNEGVVNLRPVMGRKGRDGIDGIDGVDGQDGLPGVNAVPADQAVATYAATPGTATNVALSEVVEAGVSPATEFIEDNPVVVTGYALVGPGGDHTEIINAASVKARDESRSLKIPAGTWNYNGTGLASSFMVIEGEGRSRTIVNLGAASRLIDQDTIGPITIRGLRVNGGIGILRQKATTTQVAYQYTIEDNIFVGYTGAALEFNSVDMPYKRIVRNHFQGASYAETMGVAINGGGTDLDIIEGNAFVRNRVSLKIVGGANAKIGKNDFIRWDTTRPSGPAIDVWVVPRSTANPGIGLNVAANKFGNENMAAGDLRIVMAEEGLGTYVGERWPLLSTPSTLNLAGLNISDNSLLGASGALAPFIFSTTPNLVGGLRLGALALAGAMPTYLIQYLDPDLVTASSARGLSAYGPVFGSSVGTTDPPPLLTNALHGGFIVDPVALLQQPGAVGGLHASDPSGFAPLLAAGNLSSWPATNVSGRTVTTDAMGEYAEQMTFTANTGNILKSLSALTPGATHWVEIVAKKGATSPATTLKVTVTNAAATLFYASRVVRLGASEQRIRIPFVPPTNGAGNDVRVTVSSPSGGSVVLSQQRAYRAHEPQAGIPTLTSPNGTRYKLTVSDAGALTAVAI